MPFTKIREFLSSRFADYSVPGVAVCVRTIQLIFFYNIRVDGMNQVIAMGNFVDGHGFSLSTVLPADIATNHYSLLFAWPPGYSFLLSPFYLLFNHNYIASGIAFELLFSFFQIILCRKILSVLSTEKYLINVFTFFSAFFLYGFYVIDSSDATATTFFLIAVLYTLKLLKSQKNFVAVSTIIILSLFMCGMIKYLFFVVAFAIPAYLFIKAWIENRKVSKPALFISLFLTIIFAAYLVYEKSHAGRMGYVYSPAHGFFPGNLKAIWPAIPASFVNPDTIRILLPKYDQFFFRAMQMLQVVILFFLTLTFFRIISRYKGKVIPLSVDFLLIYFLTSVFLIGLLCVLSLSVGKEDMPDGSLWTYVQEPRYYGIINVLTQILVFIQFSLLSKKIKRHARAINISFFILISIEILRGGVFITNRIMKLRTEEYSWQYELSIQQYADKIIQKERNEHPGINITVTGSSHIIYCRSGIYSHVKTLLDQYSINSFSKIRSSKPSVLLVMIREGNLTDFTPFLDSEKTQFAGHFRDFYFYTAYVAPD
jgi:hypothetical protein